MLKKTRQRFCQVFSKQVDEVRVDKKVRLERLLARCIALRTLKPQNLITLIKRLFARCTLRRDVPLGRLLYCKIPKYVFDLETPQ